MTYTDYQEIEDIKVVSPELVEIQKEQILKLFNEIKDLKEYLANERMRLSQLDKELEEKKKKWNLIEPLLEITYKTREVKEIYNPINVGFNFHSDINKSIH